MNQFKTLRHKTLPDTYAYPADMPIEFSHISTPQLMPATATMQSLKEYYKDHPKALQQLEEEYDLITVVMTPLQMPAKVTFWPNGGVSVRDKEGNDMPELQHGWMHVFFNYLEQEGYKPEKIEFTAMHGERWISIKPFRTTEGWSHSIESTKEL